MHSGGSDSSATYCAWNMGRQVCVCVWRGGGPRPLTMFTFRKCGRDFLPHRVVWDQQVIHVEYLAQDLAPKAENCQSSTPNSGSSLSKACLGRFTSSSPFQGV